MVLLFSEFLVWSRSWKADECWDIVVHDAASVWLQGFRFWSAELGNCEIEMAAELMFSEIESSGHGLSWYGLGNSRTSHSFPSRLVNTSEQMNTMNHDCQWPNDTEASKFVRSPFLRYSIRLGSIESIILLSEISHL